MCLCFYTSLRSINLNLMKLNFFIYNNYYLWNIAQNIVFNTRITKIVKMTTLIAFIYHYYKVYFCLSLSSLVNLALSSAMSAFSQCTFNFNFCCNFLFSIIIL